MNFVEQLQIWESNGALITFIVSMVPVIELRGAIPIGVAMGLSHLEAMSIAVIGNMLPVPFIVVFIRQVFAWMKTKIPKLRGMVEKLEARAESKAETVRRWQFLGLMIFVAIPLPGTGAWTGALVAGIMGMRLKHSILPILIGVIVAGILVTGITYGFTNIIA